MGLPPKSAREGVVTAAVVGVVVFLLLYVALGATLVESVLVVLLFTALSFVLDLVRGRYRREG